MSIKQRAKEYADNFVVGDYAVIVDLMHKVAEDSYIQGATEQKEIDESAYRAVIEDLYIKVEEAMGE